MRKNRKIIVALVMAAVIICGIVLSYTQLKLKQEIVSDTLAIHIYNSETEQYELQTGMKNFPTEGYVLDHYICTNGGVITQDTETLKISISTDKSDKCNLYFNVSSPTIITFTVNGTSYQAEEGMTWKEWVNSSYNIDTLSIGGDGFVCIGMKQLSGAYKTFIIKDGNNYSPATGAVCAP